ncbi:hypothetical protein PILCRDRAFT_5214, partial [Piloderma croceum F 1598]
MPSLAKHPFGWHYIYLRLMTGLMRLLVIPQKWLFRKTLHEGVLFKIIAVPSRDTGRDIKVHLYQPANRDSTKPAPVFVNWHGSGFIIPSLGENREFCSLVAARTQCVVFDADYRKAPEHPFPAAIQDAEDITSYLAANSDKYDSSNIFLGGFSAGGNIALVTASALGPERVKGVLTFYPVVDLTKRHTAPEKHFLAGVIIPAWCVRVFDDASSRELSQPCLRGLREPDTLYDPAREFVEKLKEAGNKDAEFVGLEYMAHGFDVNTKKGTEADDKKVEVYTGAVDVINSAIVGLLRFATALQWRSTMKPIDDSAFQSIAVPSRDKGRNIKVHLHQPEGYDSTKPTPVLVNWHGSSFIIPLLGANREFCSLIAARTKCLVFDADYRKAPEYPFPAAIQDAEDIVYYLFANPDKYDSSNIFLSGFSAGGSIALITASTLGPDRIKGVIGFYPAVDLTKQHTPPEKRMLAGIINRPFIRNIARAAYMLPSQPRDDPRIS